MIDTGLKDRILLRPAREGATTLCIVSGYAEPSMAWQHWKDDLRGQITIRLLIGMPEPSGIESALVKLLRFQRLVSLSQSARFAGSFECRYVVTGPEIHSKLYVWLNAEATPLQAFLGSPNYSFRAFNERRRGEIAAADSPNDCFSYFNQHWQVGVDCFDPNLERRLRERAPSR